MTVSGKGTALSGFNSGSFTKRNSVVIPVILKAGLNKNKIPNKKNRNG
jgi:hypothetical protein